ncbi:ABC transporter ATP-binding protein [Clostridium tagluense]|uniref:ABC transporter ATP-binding protein n=1 Tax=Clostridium tagluense TaxID=360422 RepID=UPI001C6F268F|nr:ABC transporter ATP-binding protein [Clostridium tagluense]MBW9159288.1 ABC transporter ATP-binding protein [Clostridium tagluense]WLC66939.1 ABC transporter ATP-binding protein [Clostridium tagluense]
MENILEVLNLNKDFKGFSLNNVTFTLEKGCIMGFIGQNGAGKTTTIKLILNAIGKSSGQIKIFEKDNVKEEIFVKSHIGYVPDEDYFISTSTVHNHAKALSLFYDNWSNDIFNNYVSKWRIPLDQKIGEFSKGMKTKAMFALAFAHQPNLLILDEPTAGLDPVARIEILDILREFVSDGEKSVFFSTHITSDLDKIADYITLIHGGKIIESLSIDKLEEKYIVLTGGMEELKGLENQFVGIRKGEIAFEGLILREKANEFFRDIKGTNPSVENLLTFNIWGCDNHEKNY